MHFLHTYMNRVLIERFRLSVYAVQLLCALNVTYKFINVHLYRIYTYMYRVLMHLGISRTVDRPKNFYLLFVQRIPPTMPGATRRVLCFWPRSSTTTTNDLSGRIINAGCTSA